MPPYPQAPQARTSSTRLLQRITPPSPASSVTEGEGRLGGVYSNLGKVKAMSTTYTFEIPLRWGDMDAYGHVNNVTIVQILEEARVALLGCPPSSGDPGAHRPVLSLFADLPEGTQALVAENYLKYRSPLAYRGMPVTAKVYISKVSPASFTVAYELYDPVDGTHCVSATTTLAFYNTTTGSLMRLSPEQRQKLLG